MKLRLESSSPQKPLLYVTLQLLLLPSVVLFCVVPHTLSLAILFESVTFGSDLVLPAPPKGNTILYREFDVYLSFP